MSSAVRPSVILIRRQRMRTDDIVLLLRDIWQDYPELPEQASVVTVSVRGKRIRRLPLK